MFVDGGLEQSSAVVCSPLFFFLVEVVFNANLQNGFKDAMTASKEVQETDAV